MLLSFHWGPGQRPEQAVAGVQPDAMLAPPKGGQTVTPPLILNLS